MSMPTKIHGHSGAEAAGKRAQVHRDSDHRPAQQGDHRAGLQLQRQQSAAAPTRPSRMTQPSRVRAVQRGGDRRGAGQGQQRDRDGRRRSARPAVRRRRGTRAPNPTRSSHGPASHGEHDADRADGQHHGRRRHQGPQPVPRAGRRSARSDCPASRSAAPAAARGSASPPGSPRRRSTPRSPEVALSSTGKPITRIALAPAAATACDGAAQKRSGVARASTQVCGRARRRRGDAAASATRPRPPTVAHRKPTRPQPIDERSPPRPPPG